MYKNNDEELQNVLNLLKKEENEKYENKISIRNFSKALFIKYCLYGIISGILLNLVISFLKATITSNILLIILTVSLTAILVLANCKLSIKSTFNEQQFKEQVLDYNDVKKIMRKILIIITIICAINSLSLFEEINDNIDEAKIKIQSIDTYFNESTNIKELQEIKETAYFYTILSIIMNVFIILIAWCYSKKEILKFAQLSNSEVG